MYDQVDEQHLILQSSRQGNCGRDTNYYHSGYGQRSKHQQSYGGYQPQQRQQQQPQKQQQQHLQPNQQQQIWKQQQQQSQKYHPDSGSTAVMIAPPLLSSNKPAKGSAKVQLPGSDIQQNNKGLMKRERERELHKRFREIERWEREREREYRLRNRLQRDFEHRMTSGGRYHSKQPVGGGIYSACNWKR